ncbi:DUF4426 domain-containing protein [Thalassotalea euphylliae]|uniref:DUF4426 domain-containing protein n=1 Tax=Thalassotalea euphylliae TaxID=1655234 RepID=UPI00363F8897
MKLKKLWLAAITLMLAFIKTTAHAENMKSMGSMDIHYMAIGATFLTPKVALAYGIQRSKYNALINISVLDNTKEGKPAKSVGISGTAQNLTGQFKRLDFEEVREGNAIYYLAQINYRDKEKIKFEIDITDGKERHTLQFNQTFYVD